MQRLQKLQRFCRQKPNFQLKYRYEQLKNQPWISHYNQNKFTYSVYSFFSVIGLLLSYTFLTKYKGEQQNNESQIISQSNLNSQNEKSNTGETQSEKSNQIGGDSQDEKSNTGELQSEKSNQIGGDSQSEKSNTVKTQSEKNQTIYNTTNITVSQYIQLSGIFYQEFLKKNFEIKNLNNIYEEQNINHEFNQASNQQRIDDKDKLINESQINKKNSVINLDQLNEKNGEIIENQVQNDCNNANINENSIQNQQNQSNLKPNVKQDENLNPNVVVIPGVLDDVVIPDVVIPDVLMREIKCNMPDALDKQCYPQILENPSNHSKEDYQNQPQQLALPKQMEVIKRILDETTKQRVIEEKFKRYLMEQLDEREFFNNYSIKNLDKKRQLSQHCNYLIPVRGDGNCFYTSFGYQFLRIVIYEYTDEEFNNFLNNYFQISLQIGIKNDRQGIIQVDKCLLSHYKDRIIYLRNLEKNYKNNQNQSEQLKLHLQAHELKDIQDGYVDGYFNPLTVLYLRNLCLHFVEQSQQEGLDKESLLQWEVECNSNEQVIALLAEKLKINIKVIFFNEKNNFQIFNYSENYENENRRIILLLKPGHYNIGIKK